MLNRQDAKVAKDVSVGFDAGRFRKKDSGAGAIEGRSGAWVCEFVGFVEFMDLVAFIELVQTVGSCKKWVRMENHELRKGFSIRIPSIFCPWLRSSVRIFSTAAFLAAATIRASQKDNIYLSSISEANSIA